MSAIQNKRIDSDIARNVRTSNEAADVPPGLGISQPEGEQLEATGELPGPTFVPPPAPGLRPHTPSWPPHIAADLELAVKWGLADYGRIAEERAGGRITRNAARATRSGIVPDSEGVPSTSSGLREPREHSLAAPREATDSAESSQLLAPDRTSSGELEPLTKNFPPEQDTSDDLADEAGLASARDEQYLDPDRSRVNTPAEYIGHSGLVPSPPQPHSWFDLCGELDQLGPVPESWGTVVNMSELLHTLPVIESTSNSLAQEFWSEVETSLSSSEDNDSETEVSRVLTPEDSSQSERPRTVVHLRSSMAIIHEVRASDNDDRKPASTNETHDKGKHVPRPNGQREFLARFSSTKPRNTHTASTSNDQRATMSSGGRRISSQVNRQSTPAQFRRDPSQVPDGGWFRASTASAGGREPPSPPSSSSSSDSDSDSDSSSSSSDSPTSSSNSESDVADGSTTSRAKKQARKSDDAKRRHRRKQKSESKRLRKALAGIKIQPPFVWSGTANLDMFDKWVYEVDTWGELNGLSDQLMLKLVVHFLSGKAGQFFMRHVATCRSQWTMKDLYEALFNYCFLNDYKSTLRAQLEHATQGERTVQEFVRDIQHLAERFPDVTDIQLAHIFWNGVHQHLHLHLIEKGFSPERTMLDRMVPHAVRKERAYLQARKEERSFRGNVPGRSWGRFASRTAGSRPWNSGDGEKKDSANKKPTTESNASNTKPERAQPERKQTDKKPPEKRERKNKLSKEELEQLRAEGRCFSCKKTGHESRSCPDRQKAKAPHVSSSSV